MTQPFEPPPPTGAEPVEDVLRGEGERRAAAGLLLTEIARRMEADCPPLTADELASFVHTCAEDIIGEVYGRLIALADADGAETWLDWLPRWDADPALPVSIQRYIISWAVPYAPQLTRLADREQLPHPCAPLLRGWLGRPRPVASAPPHKRRVMPARLAMSTENNDRARKFAPAAHIVAGSHGEQLVMPGFERPNYPAIALPLELWRMGGGPEVSRGRGEPWALRIFLGAVLSTPLEDRHGRHPLVLEDVSLRDLLGWLYPKSNRPGPAQWWQQFLRAEDALNNTRFPYLRPDTGTWASRVFVNIRERPATSKEIDGPVIIEVSLPPGSDRGPQVSPNLLTWAAKDAPASRLLLNFAYRWHNPGQTLRPVGPRVDKRGRVWMPSRQPADYDFISDNDLVAYAFPLSVRKNRRDLLMNAREALRRLVNAGEVVAHDGRYLPPGIVDVPPK